MRKTTLILVISFATLIIMACGISGYTQNKIENQPSRLTPTEESQIPLASNFSEDAEAVEESFEGEPDKQIIQIENTPTPSVDPLSSAKGCLSKTWEINGLSDYVVAAVPPELAEEYRLEYEDTTGQAFLTISPDEKIILQAENLTFLFNARFAIFEVPVTVKIDGTAAGNYSLDPTTIRIKDMDTSKMTASAKAMNEDILDSDQIVDSIPFIRPPYNAANYSCNGERLELELLGYQGNLAPLVFQAVK